MMAFNSVTTLRSPRLLLLLFALLLVVFPHETNAWVMSPNKLSLRTARTPLVTTTTTTTTSQRRALPTARTVHQLQPQLQLHPYHVDDCCTDATPWTWTVATATVASLESSSSWRQYVPLVVSFAVILDILLGSPLANAVMAPLRPPGSATTTTNVQDGSNSNTRVNPKERIDTLALANAAVERAKNTLELRRYLDENKTDYQKMDDLKKKMDREMSDIDATLEQRQRDLDGKA